MKDVILGVVAASWSMLGAMAPYLLLGFGVAGLLSVVISPEWVERHLGGSRFGQIFKASLFGVPLPLCSCGVIPVAASLRRHGAGKGATTAFLLSTPQTGVDSVAVTYGLLGPFLAIYRPIAALITGFLGGALVHTLDRDSNGETAEVIPGTSCNDDCCGDDVNESRWLRALRYGFITLPRDIGKALLVGILLSGLIGALLEPDSLEAYLGGGVWAMLAAMLIGIPLYVCATASTPIALGLIHAGLSPGAALVFLVTGPATNGAAMTTMWKVLGRRSTMIYLLTVAVCAVTSGFVVDALIDSGQVPQTAILRLDAAHVAGAEHEHGLLPPAVGFWIEQLSAVLLLAVLAMAMWPRRKTAENEKVVTDNVVVFDISGMRCNGCRTSIQRALSECDGVGHAEVDLDNGRAMVIGLDLVPERLHAAVTSLGFEVAGIE